MTIGFNSNNFNTIRYTKLCCVRSFMLNKPSLNHFKLASAKNLSTVTYTKYYCVPCFRPNKPRLNELNKVSAKKALKSLKIQFLT